MSRLFSTLLFLAAVFSTACGGGGSSTGGIVDPGPTPVDASFTPAVATPGASTVSMATESSINDRVTVRVNVTGVSDVFSVGFNLEFDPNSVSYTGYEQGNALEQGNTPVNYVVNSPLSGMIVVAASRIGAVSGANISGTGAVIKLKFQVLTKGNFPVAFQNGVLRNSAIDPIAGIGWSAGTLIGG